MSPAHAQPVASPPSAGRPLLAAWGLPLAEARRESMGPDATSWDQTASWSRVAPLRFAYGPGLSAVVLQDGRLLVAGGGIFRGPDSLPLSTAASEVYQP